MPATDLQTLAAWQPGGTSATSAAQPAFDAPGILAAVARCREPVHIVREGDRGRVGVGFGGQVLSGDVRAGAYPWLASLPALYPEWLGDRAFMEMHHVRFPYVAGEMANGIATTRMVEAAARAGMLGFFGSAGLSPTRVEAAIHELHESLGRARTAGDRDPFSWGSNLIHSLGDAALEDAIVDLYLKHGVYRVSASAFMGLTPAIVRYALNGLSRAPDGTIIRRNHVFAKISRPETARAFIGPAPAAMIQALLSAGKITAQEAEIAPYVPIAANVTVEADSGGHTDNRPLTALFPTILGVRDELVAKHGYTQPILVGAAGGLGTPAAVAAAFQLGAAYVLTASVNQAAIESGTSDAARDLLAKADLADVIMAPAGDMFELGVKVQVLKKGTMFANRGAKLYEVYNQYASIEAIPEDVRLKLEKEIFQKPLQTVWDETRTFFLERDPVQVARGDRDAKHRMALVFRWYLGQSSRWAIAGIPERRLDYQIWCGPAMGAFNAWTAGTFLAEPANRTTVQIARNLLEGAAVITRAQQLRTYGVPVPAAAFDFRPRPLA